MIAEKLLGQQLGPYYLEAILGSGGMAVVYRARTAGGDTVALKVLFPPPDSGPDILARFEREARTAARLDHPGIVRVVEVGQVAGYTYLAMPLVAGHSLAERLAQAGPLDEATVADIAWQIADALYYAHGQGVVHRDVKPSNILLTDTGQALLTDFGVALALDDPALTRTGLTVGTPAYMAPEQAAGDRPVDGRADLYALGVVLYQMVTGRTPFQGSTPQVLHAHYYTPPPRPSAIAPISAEMEAVILRALAKDVDRRFQTGAVMAEALAGLGEHTHTLVGPAPALPRRDRSAWWLALLVPLAGLAVWLFSQGQPAGPAALAVSPTRSPRPTFTATPAPPVTPSLTPTASALPSLTPAPLPTFTPSLTPLSTPTPPPPSPTAVPATATLAPPPPSPTPTAAPTATACPQPIDSILASLLADQPLTGRLGCPRTGGISIPAAGQPFEQGLLLWRKDLNLIYILGPDHTWFSTGDTWRDQVDPAYDGAIVPPDGRYQPVRGFGKVWREQPGVRDALGWATAEEAGFMATLQQFGGGLAWHNSESGELVVLLNDGTYEWLGR